jgi:hypothetical protein
MAGCGVEEAPETPTNGRGTGANRVIIKAALETTP